MILREVTGRFRFAIAALAFIALGSFGRPVEADLGLSASQLSRLRTLPIPVALPAYVPAGFHLVNFEAVRDIVRNGQHSAPANDYQLTYRGPGGAEFTISVADSGFGDAAPDYSSSHRPYTVDSPLIGPSTLEPIRSDDGTWSYVSPPRWLDRLGNHKAGLIMTGINVSSDQMREIYRSLQPLKK